MDDKKDIRFEQNKSNGQNTQLSQGHQKPQGAQGFSYLSRKSEKLTTALYMVTDILSDKEPLKWQAREAGVEVLSDITIASSASPSERMSMLRTTMKTIERVVSFLDIASSTRMITEMNASVLRKEYLALKDNVEAQWNSVHNSSREMLTERYFDVPPDSIQGDSSDMKHHENRGDSLALKGVSSVTPKIVLENKVDSLVAHQQSQSAIPSLTPRPVAPPTSFIQPSPTPGYSPQANREQLPSNKGDSSALGGVSLVAPMTLPQPPRHVLAESGLASSGRADFGSTDRRKIILALLKQKPSVTVGDIAKSIPGVSEKTIQRELLSMVADNILLKRGERRWSTYSLRPD